MDAKSLSTRQGPGLTVATEKDQAVMAEAVATEKDEAAMAAKAVAAVATVAAEVATDSPYCPKSKYATAPRRLFSKTYY